MKASELRALQEDPTVGDFPRLSRFYGVPPSELAATPRWLRELYLSAIPGLTAEEQILAFQASAYPHVDDADRKSLHDSAREMAGIERERGEQVDVSGEHAAEALGAIGIRVVVEPKREPGEVRDA